MQQNNQVGTAMKTILGYKLTMNCCFHASEASNVSAQFQLSPNEIYASKTSLNCLHVLAESGYYWIHMNTVTDEHGRVNCTLVLTSLNEQTQDRHLIIGLLKTQVGNIDSYHVQSRDHVQHTKAKSCIGMTSQYRPADVTVGGATMTLAVFAIDSDVIFSVLNVNSFTSPEFIYKPTSFTNVIVNKGIVYLCYLFTQ
jgi:hypothetical protein